MNIFKFSKSPEKDDFLFTTVIGFDIALNDAAETAVRENQIWFQDDGAWNVPSS